MSSYLLRLKSGFGGVSTRTVTSYQSNPDLAKALHKWSGGKVELTTSGSVARLRLNRPEKSNCLSGEMMIQLRQKAEELQSVSQCDVLVVEGIGPSFCSGADLGLIEEISTSSLGSAMFRYMSGALAKIHSSPLVSVARIHGHCLGGGSEIASSCDLRFAHKKAKIGFLQAKMGIVPSWGGTTYLPTIVGRSSALRLMTTAPVLSSDEAMDIGYVDAVYEEDEEFEALVSSMTKNGAGVCRAQKAMLNAVLQGEDAEHAVIRSVWGGTAQKAAIKRQMDAVVNKKK